MRRALTLGAVALLLVAGAPGAGQAASEPADPARLIVALDAPADGLHQEVGATRVSSLAAIDAEVVEVDDARAALAAYQDDPRVRYAEVDGGVRALGVPADNSYHLQWHLQPASAHNRGTLNWEPVWPDNQGRGVRVAVIDSGFLAGGSDAPVNLRMDLGWDFVHRDPLADDENGHGTHVAGTIAQRTGNFDTTNPSGRSVAGVAPRAEIVPLKVLDGNGSGSIADTTAAILHARALGADVINLSLGGSHSQALCDAVRLVSADALVVAAAGNESGDAVVPVAYPAACAKALAVGGVRYDGTIGSYSNGSCELDIVGPGGDHSQDRFRPGDLVPDGVLQESFDASTSRFGVFIDAGTSMAAAHVAGAAAVIMGARPQLAPADVARALTATARDLGPLGADTRYGHGAADLATALTATATGKPAPRGRLGYWMAGADGGIFAFGDAPFLGSTGGIKLNQPIVGMEPTPTGRGYWLVATDGGVFAFGDAPFLGSTGAIKLNQPIVDMAATPTGRGYWLVGADGGIFAFGDAVFHGSTGGLEMNAPIVGMAPTRNGRGYWLAGADGGIFGFGNARFLGSAGDLRLNAPVVAIASTGTGAGYWLVATDGGIFAFGDAGFHGSTGHLRLARPIVDLVPTCRGAGYWLVAEDGGVFGFGDGLFLGSMAGTSLNHPVIAGGRAADVRVEP